ncbi:MAG: hypothetical protein V7K62_30855 [Nostoc sp.]
MQTRCGLAYQLGWVLLLLNPTTEQNVGLRNATQPTDFYFLGKTYAVLGWILVEIIYSIFSN